jgi:hypothetical protein
MQRCVHAIYTVLEVGQCCKIVASTNIQKGCLLNIRPCRNLKSATNLLYMSEIHFVPVLKQQGSGQIAYAMCTCQCCPTSLRKTQSSRSAHALDGAALAWASQRHSVESSQQATMIFPSADTAVCLTCTHSTHRLLSFIRPRFGHVTEHKAEDRGVHAWGGGTPWGCWCQKHCRA